MDPCVLATLRKQINGFPWNVIGHNPKNNWRQWFNLLKLGAEEIFAIGVFLVPHLYHVHHPLCFCAFTTGQRICNHWITCLQATHTHTDLNSMHISVSAISLDITTCQWGEQDGLISSLTLSFWQVRKGTMKRGSWVVDLWRTVKARKISIWA